MYFFSATKKGFISLLYLCTRNDDGSMAERSKAAHCLLGDEGDACQSKNVLNRQVPEVRILLLPQIGEVAQLDQSSCLRSSRSWVRVPPSSQIAPWCNG